MLLQCGNLRVNCLDRSAGNRCKTNATSVALERAEGQSRDLSDNVTRSLGVGECLVSSSLLETVGILFED